MIIDCPLPPFSWVPGNRRFVYLLAADFFCRNFQYPMFLFPRYAVLEGDTSKLRYCNANSTRRAGCMYAVLCRTNTRNLTTRRLYSRCAHVAAGRSVAMTGPGPRPREQEIARVARRGTVRCATAKGLLGQTTALSRSIA